MALKLNDAEVYAKLEALGYRISYNCGKWFVHTIAGAEEKPLSHANGSIYQLLCTLMPGYFGDLKRQKSFTAWLPANCCDEGAWPAPKIVTEAKALIKSGYTPSKLAYPLNTKELKLIHYLLDGDPKDTYAVFFCGVGGSGKTTVCNIIADLFGRGDVCHLSLGELGNKFDREQLIGRRLWYDSDIPSYWSDSANNEFKKIVTQDYTQVEKKGQDPYQAQYRCKPLFCCNKAPNFDLTDSGMLRRVIYYFKNEKIQNPDGNFAIKVYTHEELLDIAVAALLTSIDNWVDDFKAETRQIIMQNNNVGRYGLTGTYSDYEFRCGNAGVRPYGQEKYEEIRRLFTEEWKESFQVV